MRTLIRKGTRKFTGSFYKDRKLVHFHNFKGESLSSGDPQTSIVKTHFPLWASSASPMMQPKFESAIFIARSPFDAILAELNRILTGEQHTGVAESDVLRKEVQRRAPAMTQTFSNMVHFWEGLNGYEKGSAKIFEGNGAKDFTGTRIRDIDSMYSFNIRPMKYGKGFPVFTMFYEDFVTDHVRALAYLFAYIKVLHKDKAPCVYDSIICSVSGPKTTARRKSSQSTPFVASRELCKTLKSSWNSNKWGVCDGSLQRERAEMQERLSAGSKLVLPDEICPSDTEN
mmetsp:Transcript_8437/g.15905  ORF Transcript_8437/g.15905 Transcript_8437/m.15905 type:complete len:285 (+) Transcript_8437:480-1334(+)